MTAPDKQSPGVVEMWAYRRIDGKVIAFMVHPERREYEDEGTGVKHGYIVPVRVVTDPSLRIVPADPGTVEVRRDSVICADCGTLVSGHEAGSHVKWVKCQSCRALSGGVGKIAKERTKQLEKWQPEHDDSHRTGDLAVVAATIAVRHTDAAVDDPVGWRGTGADPWGLESTPDRERRLVIAGALIAAEIDRLVRLRAALQEGEVRLLALAGLTHADFSRFRNVHREGDRLFVTTRENGTNTRSVGAIRNPNYVQSQADDFDSTYEDYEFRIPARRETASEEAP